jgi:hypothetical protein
MPGFHKDIATSHLPANVKTALLAFDAKVEAASNGEGRHPFDHTDDEIGHATRVWAHRFITHSAIVERPATYDIRPCPFAGPHHPHFYRNGKCPGVPQSPREFAAEVHTMSPAQSDAFAAHTAMMIRTVFGA